MKITNQEILDIDVDFAARKLITGAPEEYTWAPADDGKVRAWLAQTVEAESLRQAREDVVGGMPAFLRRLATSAKQFRLAYVRPNAEGSMVTATIVDPDYNRFTALPADVVLIDDTDDGTIVRFPAYRLVYGNILDIGDRLLSTSEAAQALGVIERRIRALCEQGRMGRKVGDTWVIAPREIEANRVRKPGPPAIAYEVKCEFGGYKVRKSPRGFIVEFWSAVQGSLTDDKYLLPYGTGGYGHTFERDTDLSAKLNDTTTYGDALIQALRDGAPHKILRKGQIVR